MTRQRRLPDPTDNIQCIMIKLIMTRKILLAGGLGDPSVGLHDTPLQRINWNTAPMIMMMMMMNLIIIITIIII